MLPCLSYYKLRLKMIPLRSALVDVHFPEGIFIQYDSYQNEYHVLPTGTKVTESPLESS